LEYGISIGADSKKNYLMLADLYKAHGREDKIRDLIASAEDLDSLLKDSIISSLKDML
jgi:hypothetical protein